MAELFLQRLEYYSRTARFTPSSLSLWYCLMTIPKNFELHTLGRNGVLPLWNCSSRIIKKQGTNERSEILHASSSFSTIYFVTVNSRRVLIKAE